MRGERTLCRRQEAITAEAKMLSCTLDDARTGQPKSWMGEHLPDVDLIYAGLH